MSGLNQRYITVQQRINQAEKKADRPEGSVQLLAVSKTRPAADLLGLYRLGQRHFGESYLQEALEKQAALAHCSICWHFIGPIQSNKTRPIAQQFDWVHSVDRLKIATRLSEQRPLNRPPLNICLQVNISEEDTKSGATLAELPELIKQIQALPRLNLRGVMAIPAPNDDFEAQRQPYHLMRQALLSLGYDFDTYSMGMSDDLEAAVAEGSSMVRIGTSLFGPRQKKSV